MRKMLTLVAALSLASGAAWADDSQGQEQIQGTLTVQYVFGQSCAAGDSVCSACVNATGANAGSVYVDAQGIAVTTMGPLFAKVLKCAAPTPAPYGGYSGILTLSLTPPVTNTPPAGSLIPAPKDVLTLNYSGINTDGGDFYGWEPFEGTFTIESGTGKFKGAKGTLTFIAQGGPPVTASEAGVTPSPFLATGNAFYLFQGTIQGIGQNQQ